MELPSHLFTAAADIGLAFFNIDGTLLKSRGQFHSLHYPSIARLKSKEIKTAIADEAEVAYALN
ncbi:MAG: hypothetical protein K0Q67_1792 [Cellvibrio sp.]|jgi:hydroxymethylpyrimidine pyrophosphatase-like HAD family hydrolase|nr:hypothetical protein [Cellvibrio sp.]